MFGDGSQTRSFCYVSDLIRGIIALAESGHHDPVNIGNPDEFTLLELAETVKEVTGSSSEIVFEALPVDDPKQRRPNIGLAQELLGWSPEVALREGLERRSRSRASRSLSADLSRVGAGDPRDWLPVEPVCFRLDPPGGYGVEGAHRPTPRATCRPVGASRPLHLRV